jgi:hypothetical protein
MLFPRRRHGEIEWVQLSPLGVLRLLSTPNYTADYYYRRRTLVPGTEASPERWVHLPISEWLIAKDHHDPYISREGWQTIQTLLHGRGSSRGRRPPAGRGPALLQGRIACGPCNERWMMTKYDTRERHQRDRRISSYVCHRSNAFGDPIHRLSIPAQCADRLIVREVLRLLSPPSLKAALMGIDEAKAQAAKEERNGRRQLLRLEERVEDLRRQWKAIDDANRYLKVELEAEVNAAIRGRDQMRTTLNHRPEEPAAMLAPGDAVRLVELAADLEALWHAPTTTNDDRKRIIATVVNKVIVTGTSAEAIELEIEWASGVREPYRVLRSSGVANQIVEMRKAGTPIREAVQLLAEADIVSTRGQRFSRKTLRHRLWQLGLGTKDDRLAALRKIHAMLVEQRPRADILAVLRAEGPRPADGEWTQSRLATAIQSIRERRWGDEVPPLPADTPRLVRHTPELINRIIELRQARWTFKAIASELNHRGLKPPRSPQFTMLGLYQMCKRLQDGRVPGFPRIDSLWPGGCARKTQPDSAIGLLAMERR